MSEGKKFDAEKEDWSVLDFELITPLIPVLVHGEKTYGFENWQKDFGPKAQRRFRAAMLRHIRAAGNDPLKVNEKDGGVYHYAQIAINALFAIYHAKQNQQFDEITASIREEKKCATCHMRHVCLVACSPINSQLSKADDNLSRGPSL